MMRRGRWYGFWGAMLAVFLCVQSLPVQAEYGDAIINNRASKEGMRPVIFPHWFHRIRFRCKVCHAELGFQMRAGGNDIKMADIIDGRFCGACHNNQIAWGVENCNLCHSAQPGAKTGIDNRGQTTKGPGKL